MSEEQSIQELKERVAELEQQLANKEAYISALTDELMHAIEGKISLRYSARVESGEE